MEIILIITIILGGGLWVSHILLSQRSFQKNKQFTIRQEEITLLSKQCEEHLIKSLSNMEQGTLHSFRILQEYLSNITDISGLLETKLKETEARIIASINSSGGINDRTV